MSTLSTEMHFQKNTLTFTGFCTSPPMEKNLQATVIDSQKDRNDDAGW